MKQFSRIITVVFPKRLRKFINKRHFALHLRNFLFLLLALVAGVLLQLLVLLNNRVLTAKKEFEVKNKNFEYWSRVVTQFPNIPDVLYDAALSAFNTGRVEEALSYLNRAMQLDPLFKKAQEFRKEIVNGTK